MKENGKSVTGVRVFNGGVMYDKVTEGVYSRGEVAVFDGSQINVTLMRRIGDGQLFHRKLLQHGNIRHQCDTVIDGYQTDNGTVLFHLADDVGLYAHLFKQGIQQRADTALTIVIDKGFLLQPGKVNAVMQSQRMAARNNSDNLLLCNRQKIDIRLIVHVGTEGHIVLFLLQPLQNLCGIALLQGEFDLAVLRLCQKALQQMGNVVAAQRVNKSQIDPSVFLGGELPQPALSQIDFLQSLIYIFIKDTSIFRQLDIAPLLFKQIAAQILFQREGCVMSS